MAETKKLYQVNIRIDHEFYERLRAASFIQGHAEGQLCRLLLEWALPVYERARSMEGLRHLENKEA